MYNFDTCDFDREYMQNPMMPYGGCACPYCRRPLMIMPNTGFRGGMRGQNPYCPYSMPGMNAPDMMPFMMPEETEIEEFDM